VETESFYFYYAALPILLFGMWAAWRIVHSPFGRVLVSIRDNSQRARALGYEVEKHKLIAFVLSAGLTGLAGGVFAISHGFVALTELHWTTSGDVVLMTVLGGIGTLWGGVVGAFLTVMLSDYLASSGFHGIDLVTGAVFVFVVLLFRRGVWGTVRHQWTARRLRRSSSRRRP
jgi:branched-chain amino acid transport system permease protein